MDLSQEAQKILKEKDKDDFKLNYEDVVDLIILAIRDAHLSSDEIFQFNIINDFAQDKMTTGARELFQDFYDGFTGNRQIFPREIDLYELAKDKFEGKGGGQTAKLDEVDIKDLIIHVIQDGKITHYEYMKFKETEFFKIFNMTESAGKLFAEFLEGLDRIFGSQTDGLPTQEQTPEISSPDTRSTRSYQMICTQCKGLGKRTCMKCKGRGGTTSGKTEVDEFGNVIYKDVWEYCDCSTGYLKCDQCSGSGSLPL